MTWLIAGAYSGAVALLLGAVLHRRDPLLRRRLGTHDARVPPAPTLPVLRYLTRLRGTVGSRSTAAAKRAAAAAAVPDLLDLLAVSVTAGLSPRLALGRAPDVVPDPLGEILAGVRRDVALGTPLREALEDAGTSSGLEELRSLAVTLHRAERLGSSVAERLRDLATEVRADRRLRREERARRAPVQMLFPLVFLILPAFVLAVIVPALLVATRDVL